MPFTHVNSQTSQPISTNRNPALPGPERSPPAFQNIVLPVEDTTSIPRLKPNLYVTDQEAAIPQSLRMSPSMSTPPTARSSEPLPSIRDMVPELPARGTPLLVTSNQECGPDSFQPSGPIRRAAASGLAPASLSSSRISPYPTPEATPNGAGISDRNYSNSAPSGSRSTTSRNSPIQQLSGPLAHRSEPVRALPPLNGTFGSSEASRAGSYAIPPGAKISPTLHPNAPWQGHSSAYHPSAGIPSGSYGSAHGHHLQNPSPPYAQYDNIDYGSDGKSKRRRGNLPKQVTDTLRQWFVEHVAHPYPTEDEKMMLMNATNLSMSQISNWFINARRRSMPSQMPRDGGADVRDGVPIPYMNDRV